MSEMIYLLDRRTVMPIVIKSAMVAGAIGAITLGTSGIKSCSEDLKRQENIAQVTGLVDRRNYESAKKTAGNLFNAGDLSEKDYEKLLDAVDMAPEVFELREAIGGYSYDEANGLLSKIENNDPEALAYLGGHIYEFRQEVEKIKPEKILNAAREFSEKKINSPYDSKNNLEEFDKIRKDLWMLCNRYPERQDYQCELEYMLLHSKNSAKTGLEDLEVLRKRISVLSQMDEKFPEHRLSSKDYTEFVNAALSRAMNETRIVFGNSILGQISATSLMDNLASLNDGANVPDEVKNEFEFKIMSAYENLAIQAEKSVGENARGIMAGFLEMAEKVSYPISNEVPFRKYASANVQKPELAQKKHDENLALVRGYLDDIRDNLIPNRSYMLAYQKVLLGRKVLMENGVQQDEQEILSELERMGSEMTNLMK